MALPQTLTERMARTKRSQEQRMGGTVPPSTTAARVHAPSPPTNDARLVAAPAQPAQTLPREVSKERAAKLREFEALLPAMAQHYGYAEADVAALRAAVIAPTQQGDLELVLCVRQWRIDAVANGLEGVLPEGVAQRARIQFRQMVMGERLDENGETYRPDALDWSPEPGVASLQRPRPR